MTKANEEYLVQIKYTYDIHNKGEIYYSLEIVSSYAKQYILVFAIKEVRVNPITIFMSFS